MIVQADELLTSAADLALTVAALWRKMMEISPANVEKSLIDLFGPELRETKGKALFAHWADISNFNFCSTDHMRRRVLAEMGSKSAAGPS